MVKALDSGVQGVGIGRPTTDEFDLPKKIISGEVKGAVQMLGDLQNFGLTSVAAGTQMRLVSEGKAPLDLSNEEHYAAFMKSMGKWAEKRQSAGLDMYGYVDVEDFKLIPYGTSW